MRNVRPIPAMFVVALMLVLAGCASSGSSVQKDRNNRDSEEGVTLKVDNPTMTLVDYLRRLPGVQVFGNSANASIRIRGINSFSGDTTPLFVIDDVRVGRSFAQVYSMVAMHDVESIKVLRGFEGSSYGIEGGNGVILITTKK